MTTKRVLVREAAGQVGPIGSQTILQIDLAAYRSQNFGGAGEIAGGALHVKAVYSNHEEGSLNNTYYWFNVGIGRFATSPAIEVHPSVDNPGSPKITIDLSGSVMRVLANITGANHGAMAEVDGVLFGFIP